MWPVANQQGYEGNNGMKVGKKYVVDIPVASTRKGRHGLDARRALLHELDLATSISGDRYGHGTYRVTIEKMTSAMRWQPV